MIRNAKRSLIFGVAGASLLCAGAAFAQDNGIGPPQLRDFQLRPREQAPQQPQPQGPQDPQNPQPQVRQAPRPVQVAPPPPVTSAPRPAQPQPQPRQTAPTTAATPRSAPAQPRSAPTQTSPSTAPPQTAPLPTGQQPPVAPPPTALPEPEAPTVDTPPAPESSGTPIWLYGLPAILVLLGGLFLWRRRRARSAELAEAAEASVAEAAPTPAPAPPVQRLDPSPRPWLELELKTTRASFTATEATVQFELAIANIGGAAAQNLKIDVKMFNAGAEQDKQIGSFFRTAGRDTTRLVLPGIDREKDGVIQGEVGMPLEEMQAVRLDGRMLFIPVIAVNVLYEWGDGRQGQSAKSYVVGRELETPSEKMGAFRVDQGPRVWRTVGQRQHKLARRV